MKRNKKTKDLTLLPHVIVIGNPIEGIKLIGPFDNFTAAADAAEATCIDDDWWLTPIHQFTSR